MDLSKAHKWSTFLFLVPSSLALAYCIFYLASFAPSFSNMRLSKKDAHFHQTSSSPDKIVLTKGLTRTIGQIELTYQGMDAGSIVIDITLLDLDPNYAYRRKIPQKVAESGFRLAQKQFQLISSGRKQLKMNRIRE